MVREANSDDDDEVCGPRMAWYECGGDTLGELMCEGGADLEMIFEGGGIIRLDDGAEDEGEEEEEEEEVAEGEEREKDEDEDEELGVASEAVADECSSGWAVRPAWAAARAAAVCCDLLLRREFGLGWMREWRVSSSERLKRLVQPWKEQACGFSPVWVRIWRVWCSRRWKALSHSGHL